MTMCWKEKHNTIAKWRSIGKFKAHSAKVQEMLMQNTFALHRSSFEHILCFLLITNLAPKCQNVLQSATTNIFSYFYITVIVIFHFLKDFLEHIAVKQDYIKAKFLSNLYDALQRISSNWIIWAEVKLFWLQLGCQVSSHHFFPLTMSKQVKLM